MVTGGNERCCKVVLKVTDVVCFRDRSLRFVRKGLKHLKALNILYCCNITK